MSGRELIDRITELGAENKTIVFLTEDTVLYDVMKVENHPDMERLLCIELVERE